MRGNWMRLVTAAASVAALAGAVGLPATLVVGGHLRVPRLATPPTVSRSVVHALPGAIALPPASKAPARLTTRPAPVVAQLVSAPVAQPRPHPVAPARPQPKAAPAPTPSAQAPAPKPVPAPPPPPPPAPPPTPPQPSPTEL